MGSTVLVVDDDDALRMLCRVNLELAGFRVLEAGALDAAERQLASEEIDVVLLDVHVGAENGLDLLRRLRNERPNIPVALFTGTAELDEETRAQADGVLRKPFALEELNETVARMATR